MTTEGLILRLYGKDLPKEEYVFVTNLIELFRQDAYNEGILYEQNKASKDKQGTTGCTCGSTH